MVRRLPPRLIVSAGLALALLAGGGVWWVVQNIQRTGLQMADRYLTHAAPLHIRTLRTFSVGQWQASTVCLSSEQPIGLRDAAHLRPGPVGALEQAAHNLEGRLGKPYVDDDGQIQNDLSTEVRHWPSGRTWVDAPRGILVAMSAPRLDACVLVNTANTQ